MSLPISTMKPAIRCSTTRCGGDSRSSFNNRHSNRTGDVTGLHSAYVRDEALMAANRHAEAAAEFQKVLDHRGILALDPIGALAHLQLGKTQALSGDNAKARGAYKSFPTIRNQADLDIPLLKQANAEYAKPR